MVIAILISLFAARAWLVVFAFMQASEEVLTHNTACAKNREFARKLEYPSADGYWRQVVDLTTWRVSGFYPVVKEIKS